MRRKCCTLMLLAATVTAGCGPSTRMQCRLHALDILPLDARQATLGDAIDVIERLHACDRPEPAHDGGPP